MINRATDYKPPVLEIEGVTKRFPGVLANDHIDLMLRRGEILALLGENGAGKSTLMNIIYGLYHADEGTIKLKGELVRFANPREAIGSGIGMVHQHFQLIPVMTVAENVTLGEESDRSEQSGKPEGDGSTVGGVRVLWGALWRVLLPAFAVLMGALVGQILLQLVLTLSSYLVSDPEYHTFAVERLPLIQKATLTYAAFYLNHAWITQILLYTPLLIGCVVGAGVMFTSYRHARRTWRGTELLAKSPVDSIIDAVIDLFGTITATLNQRRTAIRVRNISVQYGLEVDPDALVENLPVGLQQRVEIVKALYREADILILDEPTAVLTPQEGQELFKIMRQLADKGVSIIFITHKLKEVLQIADKIVVMRCGKVVGTATPADSTESSLAALMVGRTVLLRVAKGTAHAGDVILSVSHLSALDDRKAHALNDIGFEVRAGEVLGIAGVQGNGQTELVEVLTGLRPATSGTFSIADHHFEHVTPRDVTKAGSAHIPEDRQRYGMVSAYSVADNLVLNNYEDAPYSTAPTPRQLPILLILYALLFGATFAAFSAVWGSVVWPVIVNTLGLSNPDLDARATPWPFLLALFIVLIVTALFGLIAYYVTERIIKALPIQRTGEGGLTINQNAVNDHAQQLVREFDIRTPSINVNAGNLSGGNQQKMVVAREFSRQPRLLIASQPTRGIDVGSIEFIHQRIIHQRDSGAAVLLVSAELDEIIALSDRIAVMYQGQIIETLDAATATREQLGLLMAGVKAESAPIA